MASSLSSTDTSVIIASSAAAVAPNVTLTVPSVITNVSSSVSTNVVPSVSNSVASSSYASTSVVQSVTTNVVSSAISFLTAINGNPGISLAASTEENWETVGTMSNDYSPVGLLDVGAVSVVQESELERSGEQLICEKRLLKENVEDGLPVFLNLTFEEMCHQAAQDRRLMVLAILSDDGTNANLARLLSSISKTRNAYFWLADAESSSGRQVKRKFGGQSRNSELFVLAPTMSILSPILVDRFSGDSVKDVCVKDALERGKSTLLLLGSECDELEQRRELIEEQKRELEESMKFDKQEKEQNESDSEKETTEEIANYKEELAPDEESRKMKSIREARKKRVTEAPDHEEGGLHVVVCLPNGKRLGRYFSSKAFFQEVYDWAGSMEVTPLYFKLHSGRDVMKPEDPIESHCVIHLHEQEEEENKSIQNCEVTFKGTFPSGAIDLSTTLPDNSHQATAAAKNLGETKKKRKRRKKVKQSAVNEEEKGTDTKS